MSKQKQLLHVVKDRYQGHNIGIAIGTFPYTGKSLKVDHLLQKR
jgi:hypothetical protein